MTLTAVQGGEGLPAEPDWSQVYTDDLDLAFAHEEWGLVVRELHGANVLSTANGHAIKRLVEMRVQYERAAKHVAEHGAILPAKRAKVGQFNPYWSVMRQADEAIRIIEAELGLPPVRRGKAAKVQRGAKASRPADQFLRPVAR